VSIARQYGRHEAPKDEPMKLTAKKRAALPKGAFAGPDRSYPVPDASHARNALARASQQFNAGNLSAGQKAKIDAKAKAKLKGKPKGK
jgi:hypothetical protein